MGYLFNNKIDFSQRQHSDWKMKFQGREGCRRGGGGGRKRAAGEKERGYSDLMGFQWRMIIELEVVHEVARRIES